MVLTVAVSATIAAVTAAAAAGATAATIAGAAALAGGIAAAEWGIRKVIEINSEKGGGGGSGVPSPAETEIQGGVRVATHVLGREKIGPDKHLLAYVGTGDLGNDREALNVIHVLSEGPCEGVEKIWIDGYLAMEAPKDNNGNYMLDGGIQYLEPDNTGWQSAFNEALIDIGGSTNSASIEAIERLDEMDHYRFRAIQRVRQGAGGQRPGNPIRVHTASRPRNNIWVADWGSWCRAWVYPADGITTQTHINSSKLGEDENWDAVGYQFRGKCIVHLQFEKSNFDSPFSAPVPTVEYQLKGKKITWPGQTTPTWTENAAAIRYWLHTELEEIPPEKIDTAEFTNSFNRCAEPLTFDVDDPEDEFTKTVDRYTCNGLMLHDPTWYNQYKTDLDQCWQGHVIDSRGKLLFRAGEERPFAFDIGPQNIVKTGSNIFVPQPATNDRINAVRTTIQQSFDHDFEPYDLNVIEDAEAIDSDGVYLEREIQTLRFVKYPIAAYNILYIFLRRNRATARLTRTIQIDPADFQGNTYPRINALDRVRVTDPTLGLVNAPYFISKWKRRPDFTIDVDLRENPDGIFTDTATLPMIAGRRLSLPTDTTPPRPVQNLVVTPDAQVAGDGNIERTLTITFDSNHLGTEFIIENADLTYTNTAVAGPFAGSLILTVPRNDAYTVFARHVNEFNRRSRLVEATATVSTDHLNPPAPVYRDHEIRGITLNMFFEPFDRSHYDVSGIQFRYRVRGSNTETAFPAGIPNEATWDGLNVLDASAIVPAAAGDNFSTLLSIPFDGRYQMFARVVTRQQLRSPITNLGEFLLEGARPGAGTYDFEPDWEGTLTNVGRLWSYPYTPPEGGTYDIANALVRDRPNVAQLSFEDFNGENGWPFGKTAPATYTIPTQELPAAGNYQLRFAMETYRPPGSTETEDIDVHFQGSINGRAVGSAVDAGNGTRYVRINGINEIAATVTFNSADTAIRALRIFYLSIA